MKERRVSIIGCGWLGLPLAQSLLTEGYELRGSTTRTEKIERLSSAGIRSFHLQIGDLPNPDKIPAELLQCETLFITIPPGRKRENVAEWYPALIRAILDRAKTVNQVERVVFTSSTGVYGTGIGTITEESSLCPASPSAKAIVAAEQVLRDSNLPWIILRLAGLYGPDRHPGRWLADKEHLPNGSDPVNLVHRDDVITISKKIIGTEIQNETFNLCADEHPVKRNFYPAKSKEIGRVPPTFLPKGNTNGKKVDNAKVKKILDVTFRPLL